MEDYAQRNGFTNVRHFTDDGVSGTTFDRDGFKAMIAKVEAGNVSTIIVKVRAKLSSSGNVHGSDPVNRTQMIVKEVCMPQRKALPHHRPISGADENTIPN